MEELNKDLYHEVAGNFWSKERFTKEQAEKYAKTMINCKDCINCEKCENCTGCKNCYNCKNCIDLFYE